MTQAFKQEQYQPFDEELAVPLVASSDDELEIPVDIERVDERCVSTIAMDLDCFDVAWPPVPSDIDDVFGTPNKGINFGPGSLPRAGSASVEARCSSSGVVEPKASISTLQGPPFQSTSQVQSGPRMAEIADLANMMSDMMNATSASAKQVEANQAYFLAQLTLNLNSQSASLGETVS